jgi:hypothetical protein
MQEAKCGGTPVILGLGKLRQKNHKFEAIVKYIARPCLEKKTKKEINQTKK